MDRNLFLLFRRFYDEARVILDKDRKSRCIIKILHIHHASMHPCLKKCGEVQGGEIENV